MEDGDLISSVILTAPGKLSPGPQPGQVCWRMKPSLLAGPQEAER